MSRFPDRRRRAGLTAVVLLALGGTAACRRTATRTPEASFYLTRFERQPSVAAVVAVGREIFFDPSLSASGAMACATCHDPRFGFGPPDDAPVRRGGPDGGRPGVRAVPSLRYLQRVPQFTEHFIEDDGNDSVDQGPAGGFMWDGRAGALHEQALLPLLSPFEMANADTGAVVARLRQGRSAPALRRTFGEHVLDDRNRGLKAALMALEFFQQSPPDFYPYSSRYDGWLRGEARLDDAERRGLALFDDPAKGNCASCHPSTSREGPPVFSDWGFVALGVPRNPNIPANREPGYFDLGLCGPFRTSLAQRKEYCGRFRTPTLRNVALRRAFFHNGRAGSLADAVRFYVERDTRPARWYPSRTDGPAVFDDLPREFQDNVNREPPFGKRPGDAPALDEAEQRDVVAFLRTLTDADLEAPGARANEVRYASPKPAP